MDATMRKLLTPKVLIAAAPEGQERASFFQVNKPPKAGDDHVSAFPVGGGTAKRIPLKDIRKIGKDAEAYREELARTSSWRTARLGAEWYDGKTVEAWLRGPEHNGMETWNGWAQPMMEERQIEAWMPLQNADDMDFRLRWHEGTLLIKYNDSDEPEAPVAPTMIDFGDGRGEVQAWDVSLGLTWDEEGD